MSLDISVQSTSIYTHYIYKYIHRVSGFKVETCRTQQSPLEEESEKRFLFFQSKTTQPAQISTGVQRSFQRWLQPSSGACRAFGEGAPCRNIPVPVPFLGSGARCPSVPTPGKGHFWWLNTKEVMAGFFGLLLYCLF